MRRRPPSSPRGGLRRHGWGHWWRQRYLRHRPRVLAAVAVIAALWLIWPYATVLRLHQVAADEQPEALAGLVDIDAVRDQIRRRLNKDADSVIGEVSDPFIDWIAAALEQPGADALERQVSYPWLHALLRQHISPDRGLLGRLGWAFFSSPTDFVLRIDGDGASPLFLHLRPSPAGWKVIAVYY